MPKRRTPKRSSKRSPKRSGKRSLNLYFQTMLAAKNAIGGPKESFVYNGTHYKLDYHALHENSPRVPIYRKSK